MSKYEVFIRGAESIVVEKVQAEGFKYQAEGRIIAFYNSYERNTTTHYDYFKYYSVYNILKVVPI